MDSQQPCLSRRQVRQVDALAINRLKIPSIVLMENAGRNAAEWIQRQFGDETRAARVLCGPGNNGGDGLVITRHLLNAGWTVAVDLIGTLDRLTQDTAINHAIVTAMGEPPAIHTDNQGFHRIRSGISGHTVVIDALLGTGFAGSVREPMAELIRWMNGTDQRATIAIDVPSGLDCETGLVENVAIAADATITFVAMKTGFVVPAARAYVGEVIVADIGVPPALIESVLAAPVD